MRALTHNIIYKNVYFSITKLKVIDDEKKTQELEANNDETKGGKAKDAAWDAPYPEGVKKHKIRIPEGTEGKASIDGEDVKATGKFKRQPLQAWLVELRWLEGRSPILIEI